MTAQKPWLALAAAAGVAALSGCPPARQTVSRDPPRPVEQADYVFPQVFPAPVNWDDRSGPDGLEVLVYIYRRSHGSLPVTVRGALEFALYEGNPGGEDLARAKPFRTWRFAGEALDACRTRTVAGWGYAMRLGWGSSPPATSSVKLAARYLPPKGPPVEAPPTAIAVAPR